MAENGEQESVKIRFVISNSCSDEDDCSHEMKLCCKSCMEYNLGPTWIKENDCLQLDAMKRDVFVLNEFEGEVFKYLSEKKCLVIHPRALHTCITKGIPIPDGGKQIFSLAMLNCIVSFTSFDTQEKNHLKKLVSLMGGYTIDRFTGTVTHLVVNCVSSTKYEKAVERGTPVMTARWIEAVWKDTQQRNVVATDEEFMTYKCPVFYGLIITCTNLSRSEKESVKDAITANGGEFVGVLESERTKLLVANDTRGEKFKYAQDWKLPCVTSRWIEESVLAGHALDTTTYEIGKKRLNNPLSSTPINGAEASFHNMSAMSTISNVAHGSRKDRTHVDETLCSVSSITSGVSRVTTSTRKIQYVDVVNKLDLREAKKAGHFLDGCKVFLSGFSPSSNDKLLRVLNGGGATRFSVISDSISHVIVGNHVAADMSAVKTLPHKPHVVTADWLVESIKLQCPAPEAKYTYFQTTSAQVEPPSPSLKRSLQMLQPCEPIPFPSLEPEIPPEEHPQMNLIPQYLNAEKSDCDTNLESVFGKRVDDMQVASKPCDNRTETSSMCDSTSSFTQPAIIFAGLKFLVVGFDAEGQESCEETVIQCGGIVARRDFRGVPDYAVVPLLGATLHHAANEVVTNLWLEDCFMANERLQVLYYHQPIALPDFDAPLQDCVIGMSSYTGKEREFLRLLAEKLGAIFQEVFARKDNREKNAVASTHLICSEADTPKHAAAVKWGKPAVTHEWLLACLREGQRVDEEDFILQAGGNSISAPARVSTNEEIQNKQQNIENVHIPEEQSAQRISAELPAHVLAEMGPPTTPSPTVNRNHGFSQETPVRFPRLSPINASLRTPVSEVKTPTTPDLVDRVRGPAYANMRTPDTPYGQTFKDNPSPMTKKRTKHWIDKQIGMEPFPQPTKKRRDSTPISELKRRCWEKLTKVTPPANRPAIKPIQTNNTQDDQTDFSNPRLGEGVNTQLNQLNELLLSSPAVDGKHVEEVKLPVRRPSILEAPSSPKTPLPVTAQGNNKSIETAMKESQSDIIAWADHSRRNSKETDVPQCPLPPRFMLTSMDDRTHYTQIVVSLGGSVSSDESFDASATHLIGTRLARSEKLLASIASGKWFLHATYLDACQKEGRFLPEEMYEWGNPNGKVLSSLSPGTLEYKLATACHRWRTQLTGKDVGAFKGMRAIVYTGRERLDALKRLIIAGGGSIEMARVPFTDPGSATVCIMEPNKTKEQIDMQALVSRNVLCLPPIYLNNYLINFPQPSAADCVIPEYKEMWSKLSREQN